MTTSTLTFNQPLAAVVCGYERGGTTLVSEILRQHPKLDSGFEGGFLLAAKPIDFLSVHPYCEMIKQWGITNDDLEYICQSLTWIGVYQRLVERSALIKNKATWIFDKTPKYMQILPDALRKITNVPCIVIVRDPRSVLWSWAKRANLPQDIWLQAHLRQHCDRYLSYAEGWQSAIQQGFENQILLVQYERLCSDRLTESKRILEFIGLDFDEKYLSFNPAYSNVYGKGISSEYLFEYRNNLPAEVCEQILEATARFQDWFWMGD